MAANAVVRGTGYAIQAEPRPDGTLPSRLKAHCRPTANARPSATPSSAAASPQRICPRPVRRLRRAMAHSPSSSTNTPSAAGRLSAAGQRNSDRPNTSKYTASPAGAFNASAPASACRQERACSPMSCRLAGSALAQVSKGV